MARDMCRSAGGELRGGVICSKDEMSALATVSGSEIEARECPGVPVDCRNASFVPQSPQPEVPSCHVPGRALTS